MGTLRILVLALLALSALPFSTRAQNHQPIVSSQIADLILYDAATANEIDISTKFSDPDLAPKTVRLTTVLGDIDVALFDQQTPITVDNFFALHRFGGLLP